jgi:hypothetical protein
MHMDKQTLEKRETVDLIGSDKVEGTAVYRPDGEKIGTIDRIMIDKRSGRAAYAVMSFGGFLGIGEDHYPLPWSKLDYDTRYGGYVVNVSEAELEGAPRVARKDEWDPVDRAWERRVHDHYGVPPYWM